MLGILWVTREEKIQAAIEAAMERARNDPVNREAFVYLWYDGNTHKFYLGWHLGSPNDGYTHSSTVMPKFTADNIPPGFRRRILAYGTRDEMIALEERLLTDRYFHGKKMKDLNEAETNRILEKHYGIKSKEDKHKPTSRWHKYYNEGIEWKFKKKHQYDSDKDREVRAFHKWRRVGGMSASKAMKNAW
jgi:hypothetical protein